MHYAHRSIRVENPTYYQRCSQDEMVLSLLQPLNATFAPSPYPFPVAPDSFTCNDHYAYPKPPVRADCRIAFEQLPKGDGPEPFSYFFSDDDPNKLPISAVHGMKSIHYMNEPLQSNSISLQGTCEIWFHTSGEQYLEKDPIIINPKDIRNMAGFILDECVSGSRTGGAITKGLKKVTDWILDLRSHFPYRLMRKSLHIISSSVSTVNPVPNLYLCDRINLFFTISHSTFHHIL